jgi:hypothetical protein
MKHDLLNPPAHIDVLELAELAKWMTELLPQ